MGQLTNREIEEVLSNNFLGRIGCSNGEKIYVIPVNYVYDGHHILAHSQEGLKIDIMRNNPNVCFEVDEVQNFNNWRSVVAWGIYRELSDERSRSYVMKAFNEKMLHVKLSVTAYLFGSAEIPNDNFQYSSTKPIIYRIVINDKSGRFEKE